MVGTVGLLFKIKAVHGVGANTVRQARQEARHHQAQIARVFRLAQATPGSIFGILEDFGQIAWVCQFLPGFHLHYAWCCPGDKRTVCCSTDTRHFAQQLDILRAVIEIVVAHQAAKRFTTKLAIFLLVDFLEQRALIPAHAFIALQGAAQFLLGDAHKANLEHLISFGVIHQIAQTTPGAFQLLKVIVVNNLVYLLRQLFVNLSDQCLNGAVGIAGHGHGVFQRLLRQGFYRAFYSFACLVAFRTKFFVQ